MERPVGHARRRGSSRWRGSTRGDAPRVDVNPGSVGSIDDDLASVVVQIAVRWRLATPKGPAAACHASSIETHGRRSCGGCTNPGPDAVRDLWRYAASAGATAERRVALHRPHPRPQAPLRPEAVNLGSARVRGRAAVARAAGPAGSRQANSGAAGGADIAPQTIALEATPAPGANPARRRCRPGPLPAPARAATAYGK